MSGGKGGPEKGMGNGFLRSKAEKRETNGFIVFITELLPVSRRENVIGNPHPTPNREDPYHGSVVLLDKDGKQVTSAHAYPNGYVKFSKEATFKPVKLPPMPGAPVIPPEGVTTRKSDSTTLLSQSTSEKGKK
ncbi:hypothetical protein IFM47457_10090 [Aspergillus lentulus]|nr:hypothetical protein IFM47457_10090 [Aspergillus lentulus]